MTNGIFATLDADALQDLEDQVGQGKLDCLLAIGSDGEVTAYAPPGAESEQTMGKPEGYAQTVRGPIMYTAYYKCKKSKVNCCYIDAKGNEKCTPVIPPRPCPPL